MPGKLRISKRCCNHLGELQQILNAKGIQRKKLLQNCSNGCLYAIGEALQNIINKKVDLSPSQLGKLRSKEDDVWRFLSKGKTAASKRRILNSGRRFSRSGCTVPAYGRPSAWNHS